MTTLNGHAPARACLDHVREAMEMLARRPIYGAVATTSIRRAQAHATLALVERLDRLIDAMQDEAGDVGNVPTWCPDCRREMKLDVDGCCTGCRRAVICF